MIYKVEEIFDELFATIPTYELQAGVQSDQLYFDYGAEKDLSTVLVNRYENQDQSYPLLWYIMPNTLQAGRSNVRGDFEFVLAHNTELDLYNDQRMKANFAKVLYPNLKLVIQALQKGNNTTLNQISGNQFYEYTNYPNYGNLPEEVTNTVDVWDAIKFKVNLIITNKCYLPIAYDTQNLI